MDNLLDFIKGFSLQTIITIIAINGYFYSKTEGKFDKIEISLKEQSNRTDKLYEMFIDLLKSKNNS